MSSMEYSSKKINIESSVCPLLVCLWILGASSPGFYGLLVVKGDPKRLYFIIFCGPSYAYCLCLILFHVSTLCCDIVFAYTAFLSFFALKINVSHKLLILRKFPLLMSSVDINLCIWVHFESRGWASLNVATQSLLGANYRSRSQGIHDQAYTKRLEQGTVVGWRKSKRK